jgi:GAF domain-containing protein
VLTTRQPLVVEDVEGDPRFGREAAESTGYVPKRLMAVPLLHEDEALGVLSVLDRSDDVQFTLAEMELLGRFASQAAIGLELLLRARRANEALEGAGSSPRSPASPATWTGSRKIVAPRAPPAAELDAVLRA